MHGIRIGRKDFAQVYAGDVDGAAPDDVVAVTGTARLRFLTRYDPDNPLLGVTGGFGFHSMGVVIPAGVATVTTVHTSGALRLRHHVPRPRLWVHVRQARRLRRHVRHGRLRVREPERAHRRHGFHPQLLASGKHQAPHAVVRALLRGLRDATPGSGHRHRSRVAQRPGLPPLASASARSTWEPPSTRSVAAAARGGWHQPHLLWQQLRAQPVPQFR